MHFCCRGLSWCTDATPMREKPDKLLAKKERESEREFVTKSVQGTKTGDPRTVHSVYITDSDICSQGQDV